MKILVFIKQVPNTNEVKIDPIKGTLIREGVPSIINPDDLNALEAALCLKDKISANVSVVTMGPPQAEAVLREALAMGADNAYLLTDRAFSGADTWSTSLTLAKAAEKIGFDIILTGRQAIDGDTAQVGPEMAEHLNIPQVTYVEDISINGDLIKVKRSLEDGYEIINVKAPCLLTAVKELNTPRYMNMWDIFNCFKREINVFTADDLKIDKNEIGLLGSPTKVIKSFTKELKGQGEKIDLAPSDAANYITVKLKEKHLI